MALRAVLFDFDGVLVNSEPLHHASLREALRPEGIDIDEEEYARTYLAYDDWEAVRIALERHGHRGDGERIEAIAGRKAVLFEQMQASVPFFPGARELIDRLSAHFPLAIASGARRKEIETILTGAALMPAFAAIVGADDVSLTKPHPEPYLTAMARLVARAPDLAPSECLVIEDSMAGILSGLLAGMRVLAVAHSYAIEKLAKAHRVVPSLEGLTVDELRSMFVEQH
jgi:beta-phosphoglucomutase